MIVQHIKYKYPSYQVLAEKYYTMLINLRGIHCTKQEIRILAFAALHGNISTSTARTECQQLLGISKQSLNNTIAKLQKDKLFVKTDKIKVNPEIALDFTKGLLLKIELYGDKQEVTEGDSSGSRGE